MSFDRVPDRVFLALERAVALRTPARTLRVVHVLVKLPLHGPLTVCAFLKAQDDVPSGHSAAAWLDSATRSRARPRPDAPGKAQSR